MLYDREKIIRACDNKILYYSEKAKEITDTVNRNKEEDERVIAEIINDSIRKKYFLFGPVVKMSKPIAARIAYRKGQLHGCINHYIMWNLAYYNDKVSQATLLRNRIKFSLVDGPIELSLKEFKIISDYL